MKIIYLIPTGGYSSSMRSDTLWGILCWGIRYLSGKSEVEKFIQAAANGNPEFVISSTFPFKQHGTERIPFFPNPLIIAPEEQFGNVETALENYRLRKKRKEIEWLSIDDFSGVLQGKLTVEDLNERIRTEFHLKKQAEEEGFEFFPSGQTVRRTPPILEENTQTHNTIDRLQGGTLSIPDPDDPENPDRRAGQLFHSEEYFWTDLHNESDSERANTGLFFLVEGQTEKIVAALRLFRHLGFGADRTTGKGFFDFEMADFTFDEPPSEKSNALLNLSLYHPTQPELIHWERTEGCLQYLLERREGRVGGYRELRRKQPRLYFREGSVFGRPEGFSGRFMGGIRKQEFEKGKNPPHDVWDNGYGLMVNINWKNNGTSS